VAGDVYLGSAGAAGVYLAAGRAVSGDQGLYNGFLVAGLGWALLIADPAWHRSIGMFFLGCVAVAGLYGAATAGGRILLVQTLPAALWLA